MSSEIRFSRVGLLSRSLQVACLLILLPTLFLAYIGIGWWSGLEGLAQLSATALAVGPIAPLLGLLFARKADRDHSPRLLFLGLAALLALVPLYVVACSWGGRMLI